MRNTLLPFFILFATFSTSFGQFNWKPIGGPDGGGFSIIQSNDQYLFYANNYKLYRSADGIHWEKLDSGPSYIRAINNHTLVGYYSNFYSTTGKTLKISTDNGVSWQPLNTPQESTLWYIGLTSEGIFLPSKENLYYTLDQGMTWDTIQNYPIQGGYDIYNFANKLYIHDSKKIWRSDSTGQSWELIGPDLLSQEYISAIFVDNEKVYCSTSTGIWSSLDDGENWEKVYANIQFGSIQAALGNQLFTDSRIHQSSDLGHSWNKVPTVGAEYFHSLTTFKGNLYAQSNSQGVFRLNPNTNQMEPVTGISDGTVLDMEYKDSILWVASGKDVYKYNLVDSSWKALGLPISHWGYDGIQVGDNGILMAHKASNIYISNDTGMTWSSQNSYPSYFSTYGNIVDNVIFINSDDFLDIAQRSIDGGQTWSYMDSLQNFGKIIKHKDYLLALTTDAIKKSTNQGASWTTINTTANLFPMEFVSVNGKLFGFSLDPYWISKLYVSSDDGITWQYSGDGLPSFQFDPIADENLLSVHYHDNKYYLHLGAIYGSKDSCKTWLPISKHGFSHSAFSNDIMFAGNAFPNAGGVVKSTLPEITGGLFRGKVYHDKNSNNIFDASDDILQNFKVGVNPINHTWFPHYFTTTDENGDYSLGVNPNIDDTISVFSPNDYVESIEPDYYLAENYGDDMNFAVSLTPDITDLSIRGYVHRPRPGFDLSISSYFRNKGTIPTDATVSITLDQKLSYLEANPAPTQISGNILTWNIGEMPIFSYDHLFVKANLSATATLGDVVTNTFSITSANTDNFPDDNIYTSVDTIVGSFDPNDKQVSPIGGLSAEEIVNGDELFYTIRFQNTGTYLAEKVRITDMLDTALNYTTLRFVGASHDPTSFQLRPGGLLEIVFDQINLPDSTSNEVGSHGFVTYAIQRKKAFSDQDRIENTAAIYFDFNEPIFTNTVTFTVREDAVVGTQEVKRDKSLSKLLVTPNPTNDIFFVSTRDKIQGEANMVVFDIHGKVQFQQSIQDATIPIQLSAAHFPKGIYFINLVAKEGVMVGKVVVQ